MESGSRAWGFPSPDSDFDCRFIFVRRRDDYLSPWPKRDVIETPLEDDLDINGWELGKALRLLLKGNAVVLEWLRSPIVYDGDFGFRDGLSALAARFADRAGTARHYLHLGERQRRPFRRRHEVQLKKLSMRSGRRRCCAGCAPSGRAGGADAFPDPDGASDPPADVLEISAELIRRKARTRELGAAPLPGPIERFVEANSLARETLPSRAARIRPSAAGGGSVLPRLVERLGSTPSAGDANTAP